MDVLNETITIPVWPAAATVAVIIVATMLIRRLETRRLVASAISIAALLAVVVVAVPLPNRAIDRRPAPRDAVAAFGDRAAERRSLEARRAELTGRAITPGSPLACLDALAGEPVESTCEQTVFASPLAVAVAVSYAAARLRLLADGIAFARHAEPGYETSLADMRLAAENDAYGIYAHVLATRDGCTPERCAAFALLRDASTIKIHLRQRLYATYVARHRDLWSVPSPPRAVPPVASVQVPESASATTASAPSAPLAQAAAAPVTATPVPKPRPASTVRGRGEAATSDSAAAPGTIAPPPAAEGPPARSRGLVPPVASVLPNIDFPSSSSIPPINIMAAEPKLPPVANPPPSAPAAGPQGSPRP
ncbi:MAG: hypothetical protein GEU91_22980 [Rhizobiales bacterium]|nr:hypothetical protein [Hyphomicrobiales bacterium]